MRWITVTALLLAGCAGTSSVDFTVDTDRPCPGHFHITLLVADGDEVLPYFSPEDQDASGPVAGIHMHGNDGLIHIHPATPTCYTLRAALHAVGVDVPSVQRLVVDGSRHDGPVTLAIQQWQGNWETMDLAELDEAPWNAARVLLMVNGPADRTSLQEQVPAIPPQYQPA